MAWNNKLALIWTKMVGPSRPTASELAVYTKYAHKLMSKVNRRLRILILGSTPEFRDWAYEENMEVWVLDANKSYNRTINRELRHKIVLENKEFQEQTVIDKWQNLNKKEFFDIIIGDLSVGNVAPDDLEPLLKNISDSLTAQGLYLGKSFFVPENFTLPPLEKVCKELYTKYNAYHPYSYLAFYLTMASIDENNLLDFKKQYELLLDLNKKGLIKNETLKYFKDVGWDSEMQFKFYVPDEKHYKNLLTKFFHIAQVEYGLDVYSKHFPLFIATKIGCFLYD